MVTDEPPNPVKRKRSLTPPRLRNQNVNLSFRMSRGLKMSLTGAVAFVIFMLVQFNRPRDCDTTTAEQRAEANCKRGSSGSGSSSSGSYSTPRGGFGFSGDGGAAS